MSQSRNRNRPTRAV